LPKKLLSLFQIFMEDGQQAVVFGAVVTLQHFKTKAYLASHVKFYEHAASSNRRMIICLPQKVNLHYKWQILPSRTSSQDLFEGQPVVDGDIIKFQNIGTEELLYSDGQYTAPINQTQFEVSGYKGKNIPKDNVMWRVEIDGDEQVKTNIKIKFINVATNCTLHSHGTSGKNIDSLQEVTCFKERDDNDYWVITEARSVLSSKIRKIKEIPLVNHFFRWANTFASILSLSGITLLGLQKAEVHLNFKIILGTLALTTLSLGVFTAILYYTCVYANRFSKKHYALSFIAILFGGALICVFLEICIRFWNKILDMF